MARQHDRWRACRPHPHRKDSTDAFLKAHRVLFAPSQGRVYL